MSTVIFHDLHGNVLGRTFDIGLDLYIRDLVCAFYARLVRVHPVYGDTGAIHGPLQVS